jgi:hypothetical protein
VVDREPASGDRLVHPAVNDHLSGEIGEIGEIGRGDLSARPGAQ